MTILYKVILVIVLGLAIFSLGQSLYYMMKDPDEKSRMVWALTRRITFSLLVIVLVIIGIWTGWLHPHGIGG